MDMKQILELVNQPAFLTKEGKLYWCNAAARQALHEGLPVCDLMEDHGALFSLWDRQGTLQLPLVLGGEDYDASVCAVEEGELFVASCRTKRQYEAADVMMGLSATLRRTLQTMLNAARSLFDEMGSSPEAAQMNRALYQLVRLCSQYSDGGQLLGRCRSAHRRPVDMDTFFDDFATALKPLLKSTGRTFRYMPLKGSVRADIDAELMERALYNLISNALQYTPDGGEICLQAERRERSLLVRISDTGEGIPPQVLATLFERFDTLEGDGRRGAGLGLPIAREIIRLHGGTMTVTADAQGKGTTVTFALPLIPAPLELRSRTLRYDYCGDLNHSLVELSDVLPTELYDPEEVL